jgi:AcrR family transcriptional regulator
MMTDDDFQRARRPEQKEERKLLLVTTARELLLESGEQDLSLNEIARRAGMAKSNVYRYFESREAVFIDLLRYEWSQWFSDLEAAIALDVRLAAPTEPHRAQGSCDLSRVDAVLEHIAEAHARRPLLGRLSSILAAVIERNVSAETVRSFKLESVEFVAMLATFLHAHAPELTKRDYEELFHAGFVALIGLWPFSHPAPQVAAVLEDPRLAPFRHDFVRDYRRHLSLLARGLALETSHAQEGSLG